MIFRFLILNNNCFKDIIKDEINNFVVKVILYSIKPAHN
jgi:hypothetical protein